MTDEEWMVYRDACLHMFQNCGIGGWGKKAFLIMFLGDKKLVEMYTSETQFGNYFGESVEIMKKRLGELFSGL